MQIQYEYFNQYCRDEFEDEYPTCGLACVPRVGDYIAGTEKGFVLKVMAVTLMSQDRVSIVIGMEKIGQSDPVFKNVC